MQNLILLSTLNSSYQHTAFGLRYLFANMNELQDSTSIKEFTIKQTAKEIAEEILKLNPKILGLGIYIWNTTQSKELVSILKKINPNLIIILGGPEVSYETNQQQITRLADYVICGEGDFLFYDLCRRLLSNETPSEKIIPASLPEISKIKMPYSYYSDEDIRNRYVYVEASRGCPYKCEYCLSSLDKSVRNFDLNNLLNEFEGLIQKGARNFKFIDRTFNLSPSISQKILNYFLDRSSLGLFLHFEMVPDRLPTDLREIIKKFPKGSLQFEIGIQTWNPIVAQLISRRNDLIKTKDNIKFLSEETNTHLHTDLIVGLPGENIDSFAKGFDQLVEIGAHEIQVGMLKRLRGAPIIRHDTAYGMIYQEQAPYQILQTKDISYLEMQKMSRFAKYWDLIGNSGNFNNTITYLKETAKIENKSFFSSFFDLSEYLSQRHGEGHSISLINLFESVWVYLTEQQKHSKNDIREILSSDYTGKIKRDLPRFLRTDSHLPRHKDKSEPQNMIDSQNHIPKRQQRHIQ